MKPIPILLATGTIGGKRNFPRTFLAHYNAEQSTVTTSRKAYPKSIATDTAVSVSAGAEYSLDGGAWTADPGAWGASRYIQVRGESSATYGEAAIHTVTIGALELDFTVWTMENPDALPAWTDEDLFTDSNLFTD